MTKNSPFRNGVPLKMPKYIDNTSKKRKSVFIDRNSIPTITKDLGFFDYDSIEKHQKG